jgi:hypothetical protein
VFCRLAKKIFEVQLNLKNFLIRRRRKGNPSAKRDFLKILGSNFILKDRTLLFSSKKPFSLLPRKGLDDDWLSLADEIRDHFKGTLEVSSDLVR